MACRKTSSAASRPAINVMFLCDEWKSSKGGLSTFNREFAVNLAKTTSDSIKVYCYVSQSDEPSREDARQNGVELITARNIPGSGDKLDWLKIPPRELPNPDIVVGHGRKFGTPAYFIVQNAKCKWIHFVHVFCEDLGKFKETQCTAVDTIEENEKKHKSEIELCEAADVVFAVGSRLQQKYSNCLPHVKVDIVTPGIFEKFLNKSPQLVKDNVVKKKFRVFMFGRASFEDLTLKGYDIVADAIGSLGKTFELIFVGSSPGEHTKIRQWFLDKTSISRNQLTIRGYCNEEDKLKMMYHESDIIALPSRSEGFGLVALEAISAGIPVLVGGETGIAEALHEVEGGRSVIIESDQPEEWAQRIQQLSKQSLRERKNSAKLLRENYSKTYSWSNECKKFDRTIKDLAESLLKDPCENVAEPVENDDDDDDNDDDDADGDEEEDDDDHDDDYLTETGLKLRIDVETMTPAEHNTQDRTPVSASDIGGHHETTTPVSSGQTQSSCTGAEALQAPMRTIPSDGDILRLIASNYLLTTPPSCKADRNDFLAYMREMRVLITGVDTGSLLITVKCNSLEILETLWEDYSSGHLGEVVQRCFVTEEILIELSLAELILQTTISEEEYMACKMYFEKDPAGARRILPIAVGVAAGTAAVAAAPAVVGAVGFTAGGVAAGSIAASVQSAVYGSSLASGSVFALLQSAGAAGFGAAGNAAIGGIAAGIIGEFTALGQYMFNSRVIKLLICGCETEARAFAGIASSLKDTEVRLLCLDQDEAERCNAAMKELKVTFRWKGEESPSITSLPALVTNNPEDAIRDVNIVVFLLPASALQLFLDALKPHIKPGTIIVGLPGGPGFEFQVLHVLGDVGQQCTIMNFESSPWVCHSTEFGVNCEVLGNLLGAIKQGKDVAPEKDPVSKLQSLLGPLELPKLIIGGHLLGVQLMSVNAYLNTSIVYGQWEGWDGIPLDQPPLFYSDLTESAVNFLSSISDEVLNIAKGIELKTGADMSHVAHIHLWLVRRYSHHISDNSTLYKAIQTNAAFQGIKHPVKTTEDGKFVPDFTHRYMTEDVPYGLVVIRGIAEIVGVQTPNIDKLLKWCQEKMGKEYLVNSKLQGNDVASSRAPQRYGFTSLESILSVTRP